MAVFEVPLISPLTEGIDELVNTSHGHRPFPPSAQSCGSRCSKRTSCYLASPLSNQALNLTDCSVPSERRSDDSTVETDIEVLTFHAAALSNNPSTTNPHIKQNAQPHGNTTKISHSNHLTNHPSQNNQFSTKSDYITQPHPSILPNKSRNWSNLTYAPSDKLVEPLTLTDE